VVADSRVQVGSGYGQGPRRDRATFRLQPLEVVFELLDSFFSDRVLVLILHATYLKANLVLQ